MHTEVQAFIVLNYDRTSVASDLGANSQIKDISVAYADEQAFARYLRMGRDWPQLRCPLAIAILVHPSRQLDPYGFLDERVLSEQQASRTILTAENLHRHFGISVRSLTPEMAQLEWHRALSAATYILFNLLEDHPHIRYDPYYNYVEEADQRNLRKMLRGYPADEMVAAFSAFEALYRVLFEAKDMAALFRASFITSSFKEAQWEPPAAAHDLFRGVTITEPQECRQRVVRNIRELALPMMARIPARAASAAAMGIDWKLIDKSDRNI